MRVLIDKNVLRRWFEAVIKSNLSQPLTTDQELVVAVLATARSQGLEVYITLETYNILTTILRNPNVAKAIMANGDVLYRSKPFNKWLRNISDATTLTREDAKIVAYATFGTNISGTILGCEKLVTLDRGLRNEFEVRKATLKSKLKNSKRHLPSPYQNANLPQLVLLETETD